MENSLWTWSWRSKRTACPPLLLPFLWLFACAFGWTTKILCFRFQGGQTMAHEYEGAPVWKCWVQLPQGLGHRLKSHVCADGGSLCTLPWGPSLHTLSPHLPPTYLPPLLSTGFWWAELQGKGWVLRISALSNVHLLLCEMTLHPYTWMAQISLQSFLTLEA